MVINSELKFEIEEYMAPSLAEQAEQAEERARATAGQREGSRTGDSGGGGGRLRRQVSVSELSRQQSDSMDAVVLERLKQWVTEYRADMEYYYKGKDSRRRGYISLTVWREGLCSVLRLRSIQLVQYQRKLVDVESDGTVDYLRFLGRYEIAQDDEDTGWQSDIIQELYETLVEEDQPLHVIYSQFDPRGTQHVTAQDFKRVAHEECQIILTQPQSEELLRSMYPEMVAGVGVERKAFVERFHSLYASESTEHPRLQVPVYIDPTVSSCFVLLI